MSHPVRFIDVGHLPYAEAWELQKSYFQKITQHKLEEDTLKAAAEDYLLFCEHTPVYTLGKSGNAANLLLSEQALKERGIDLFRIDRGGDITYHGPGQLVGYPILDLEHFKLGVKDYIFRLEQAVIETLKEYGIKGERLDGAAGVWLDVHEARQVRKICAIGVRVSRLVTMHGFAFNINTDLDYFSYINPCGFTDKGVASLANELGLPVDMEGVKLILKDKMAAVFNMQFKN